MTKKLKDLKIVPKCTLYGCALAKYSRHHFMCYSCWLKHNREKGVPDRVLHKLSR